MNDVLTASAEDILTTRDFVHVGDGEFVHVDEGRSSRLV